MGDDPIEHEFRQFLQKLIEGDYLEGAELGITKQVTARGKRSLTPKQSAVFEKQVIGKYVHDKCAVCHQDIPWSEMFFAVDKGTCAACGTVK